VIPKTRSELLPSSEWGKAYQGISKSWNHSGFDYTLVLVQADSGGSVDSRRVYFSGRRCFLVITFDTANSSHFCNRVSGMSNESQKTESDLPVYVNDVFVPNPCQYP
jgi:hypothetical protein